MAWESPDRSTGGAGRAHPWESEEDGEADPLAPSDHAYYSDSGLEGDVEMNAEDLFIEYCTELLLAIDLTSKQLCEIMYHAGNAGISKALSSGSISGHYQRKVNRHLGRAEGEK